jgi:hypothetical protein
MLSFASHDFVPLEQSGRWWRWSEARTNRLPPSALAHIRALRPERAADLAPRAAFLCAARRDGMTNFPAGADAGAVRLALGALGVDAHTRVVVSWDETDAVLTDWSTFVAYWDDFCYPGSDDLTVWPVGEEWTLCYDHTEQFRFAHHDRAV